MYDRERIRRKTASNSSDTPESSIFKKRYSDFSAEDYQDLVPSAHKKPPSLQTQKQAAQQIIYKYPEIDTYPRKTASAENAEIQAKLTIGEPGDKYEQEADQVADRVINMPETPNHEQIQRQGEEEELLQTQPEIMAEVPEYAHIVIDKKGEGLGTLRQNLNENGLQTAATLKIDLAEGSKKLGHDRHVFMWDDTEKGRKGAAMLLNPESTITIKIRKKGLTIGGFITQGTLKIDNMGALGKGEQTGAWAYEGDIERKYIFIEGLDKEGDPGYEDWKSGEGWLDEKFTYAMKGGRAIGEERIRQKQGQQ